MSDIYADRVIETSSNTPGASGTVTVNLSGTSPSIPFIGGASSAGRKFVDVLATTNKCIASIYQTADPTKWCIARCTFTTGSPNTLTFVAADVRSGSAGVGALVTWTGAVTCSNLADATLLKKLNGDLGTDGFAPLGVIVAGGVPGTALVDPLGNSPTAISGQWIPRTGTFSALSSLSINPGEIAVATDKKANFTNNSASSAIGNITYANDISQMPLTQTDIDNRVIGFVPAGSFTLTVQSGEDLPSILNTYVSKLGFHSNSLLTVNGKAGADAGTWGSQVTGLNLPNVSITTATATLTLTNIAISGTTATFTVASTATLSTGKVVEIDSAYVASDTNAALNIIQGLYSVTVTDGTHFTITVSALTGTSYPTPVANPSMTAVVPAGWFTGAVNIIQCKFKSLKLFMFGGVIFSSVDLASSSGDYFAIAGGSSRQLINLKAPNLKVLSVSGGLTIIASNILVTEAYFHRGALSLDEGTTFVLGDSSYDAINGYIGAASNTAGNGINVLGGSQLLNGVGSAFHFVNQKTAFNITAGGKAVITSAIYSSTVAAVSNISNNAHTVDGSYLGGAANSTDSQSIAYAASITPNMTLGQTVIVGALTGNITINAPTNPVTGQRLILNFTSDATPRQITYNAVFKTSVVPISTGSAKASNTFSYDGTNWIQTGGALLWL